MTPQQEKIFTVSLKGLAPWISAVRYEKGGEDLKLHFTIQKEDFSPAHLSFQEEGTDTLIVGNKQSFFQLLATHKTPASRLLGKILNAHEYLPDHATYTASLGTLSSQETKLLPRCFSVLKEMFGSQSSYLLLFEASEKFQGLAWISIPSLQQKVAQRFSARQRGNWILFETRTNPGSTIHHALS